MNTIIALTFIGILTYAFAEEPCDKTECKHEPMANFNPTKYLQMTPLYSTHAKYSSNITVCRVFTSITISCDAVNINIHGYYNKSGNIYDYEMFCNTTETSFDKAEYLADCKIVKDAQFEDGRIPEPFKLYMSVIDTDYENYAILYLCINDEYGLEDNFEVLQKNPGTSNEAVSTALKNNEMDLEKFFPRDYTYCQSGNKDEEQ
uniref:Triabin n=1 Tax=Triatoma dimidiata TaxID=72491 RepID=D1MWD8_TRIDM|nr:hypothetical protein Td38 similar to pallidipin-like salivary lipocalin [Triatoma dimidiata]